jgi:D-alanyl-D-alanine carboxypeptidase (penicillin-binding protein 5/6)
MHNKVCSTTLIMLLFLAGCIPTKSITVQTHEIIQPMIGAALADTPVSTSTSVPVIVATLTGTPISTSTSVPVTVSSHEFPNLDLQAQSAILFDARTGKVLYAKNAHQQMYPASTTKIMTAILALEYFKTDEIIQVGDESQLAWTSERIDATKAGLNYGQKLTMKELLYGLLLASGSDAAITIAVNVAKRESGNDFLPNDQALTNFYALMNQKAKSIGAVETNFTSPDGMQDPSHYSTAYDLALIAQYAMQDPQFRKIVAAPTYTAQIVTQAGEMDSRAWGNTNLLIRPQNEHYYTPANGIKTGTTLEAGHCLISSAMVRGNLVIAVVLNSTQEGVWSDSVTLLEYANDNPQ